MTHIRTHHTILMSFTKGVFCLRLLFRFRSAPETYGGNDNGMKEHSQTNRSLHDPINVIIVADHHHRFTETVPASSFVTCVCNRTGYRLSTVAGGQRGALRENVKKQKQICRRHSTQICETMNVHKVVAPHCRLANQMSLPIIFFYGARTHA